MKKSCSNFLQTPLKVGMPVFAVACFAITGMVSAAEPAQGTNTIQREVDARSRDFSEIRDAIAKVESMTEGKDGKIDFGKAFAELKAIQGKLEAKQVTLKGNRTVILYFEECQKRFEKCRAELGVLAAEAKFQEARKLYEEASRGGVTPVAAEKANEAKDLAATAKYYYYLAPLEANFMRDPAALDKSITAFNQNFSVQVERLSAACEKIITAFEFRMQTDTTAVDPNYANRMNMINTLYAKANNLYRKGLYTQARDICEQIFIEDPSNAKAIALLDKIYKKLYFYSELRAYNELLRSDAESIWLWSNAITSNNDRADGGTKQESGSDKLREKLNTLKISVAFQDYTIKDAINAIREKIREADPRREGVNFLETGIAGTPTADITLTLELDNVPASVVLNYLCKKTGISWMTNKNFVRYGLGFGDYVTEEIDMENSVYRAIASGDEEGGDDEGGDDDSGWNVGTVASIEDTIKDANAKKRGAVSDVKLKRFFENRGIVFDANSSVIYSPRTRKLTATISNENLQSLEQIVREMSVNVPQVLIESKILEISVNDEEELGFDWSATYQNTDSTGSPPAPGYSKYDFAFTSPLRSVAPSAVNRVEGIVNDKLINNLNIIPNMRLNGNHLLNFYLTVSAVDRTDRLEQLSTPKVLVKNGDTAVIKMVRSMYFPDSWEEPDVEIDDGDVAMETSYPEFGEPDQVGIQFTVTPTVATNNYTIQLDLEPMITDLVGWTDYSYDMVIRRSELDSGNSDNSDEVPLAVEQDLFRVKIKMPEISKRELITKLKCFDGHSLMVGGMVIDKQVSMEDRYPILGDLPILGRFFTKTSDSSARSNLMISVSPRIIYHDGTPVYPRPSNGVPDFRFRK